MKKFKFLFVGETSEFIASDKWKNFLNELGLDFSFEQIDTFPDLKTLSLASKMVQGIRVDAEFINDAYHSAKGVNPLMVQLQAVDFLYCKNNVYWPKLVLRDGLQSAILHKHPQLSSRDGGLIVGTGIEARIVASVLVELGFKHITFVENENDVPGEFLEELRLNYFQINFEMIGPDKVILLPGIYSVIVNTWNINSDSELLTDLLYFNYLKDPGLVVNLRKPDGADALIDEAQAINEMTLQRSEVEVFAELSSLRPFVELKEQKIRDFLNTNI